MIRADSEPLQGFDPPNVYSRSVFFSVAFLEPSLAIDTPVGIDGGAKSNDKRPANANAMGTVTSVVKEEVSL